MDLREDANKGLDEGRQRFVPSDLIRGVVVAQRPVRRGRDDGLDSPVRHIDQGRCRVTDQQQIVTCRNCLLDLATPACGVAADDVGPDARTFGTQRFVGHFVSVGRTCNATVDSPAVHSLGCRSSAGGHLGWIAGGPPRR